MGEYFEFLRHPQPLLRERDNTLALSFGGDATQSLMCRLRPFHLELVYTRTMMAFLLFQPEARQVLMIGLGGGSLAKFCHRQLAQAQVTVVEINPHVIALREHFQVPEDEARLQVLQADGAEFVAQSVAQFDAVLVDGFDENGASAQLGSVDFYRHCRDRLAPGGVLVVNLDTDHPQHELWLQRLGEAFAGHCVAVEVPERRNLIAFAGTALAAAPADLQRALQTLPVEGREQLQAELERVSALACRERLRCPA